MQNRSGVVSMTLLTVGALLLSGCAAAGSAEGSADRQGGDPVAGGDLVIARSAGATSMDLTTVHNNNSIFTADQIMEPLFMGTDDGKDVKLLSQALRSGAAMRGAKDPPGPL